MPVLLFDIDGTLLNGNGVGRRAVETSLRSVFGVDVDISSVSFSGKTDPQIFREILTTTSLAEVVMDVEASLPTAIQAYHDDMSVRLTVEPIAELPGGVDLVRRLRAENVPMGLLTGNLHPLAYLKVGRIGLESDLFPFGAFGSDSEHRNELPAIAATRAAAHLGRTIEHVDLVVIGDTPRDIECARAVGARVVAVTTGHFSSADLVEADLVVDTLEALDLDTLLYT